MLPFSLKFCVLLLKFGVLLLKLSFFLLEICRLVLRFGDLLLEFCFLLFEICRLFLRLGDLLLEFCVLLLKLCIILLKLDLLIFIIFGNCLLHLKWSKGSTSKIDRLCNICNWRLWLTSCRWNLTPVGVVYPVNNVVRSSCSTAWVRRD